MFELIKYRGELQTLEREIRKIQQRYAGLGKGLSGTELQELHADESSEVSPLLEDIEVLKTRRFVKIADRLMVPLPDRNDEELWEDSTCGTTKVLTAKGYWELKTLIRQDKRERSQLALMWLAALTGIIGVTTGLLAVLGR